MATGTYPIQEEPDQIGTQKSLMGTSFRRTRNLSLASEVPNHSRTVFHFGDRPNLCIPSSDKTQTIWLRNLFW